MTLITTCWGLDSIIVITALVVVFYLYMTRNFKYWKKRGVLDAGSPRFFFGNFAECLFFKKAPADFLKELYDQATGLPYLGFYVLDKPFLLIRDQELVKNVLVKDFHYFTNRYICASEDDRLGYANLFFLKNSDWKGVRTKLTPFFTSGKMRKMFDLMMHCGRNLDAYLDSPEFKGDGQTIEVKELFARFTTDVVGSTAYGLEVNSFRYPDADFVKYSKMIFYYSLRRAYEMLAIFFFPNIVRSARIKIFGKKPTLFLRKVFWETFTQRIKSGAKRNDLIDILIELKQNYGNQKVSENFTYDGDDLMAQAASFFSAGSDTSATAMTFVLYILAVEPEIQNTVRKEILETLNQSGGKITYDMILSLSYLDKVVSETLRMYPPLGYLNRVTNEAYKVPDSNLTLEKDTPVYISMLGMHYDPEYFPNPEKFDPERFNEENRHNRPSGVYIPFGDGPHNCIGIRFALLQAKLGLVHILSKCEVTPSEKTTIPVVIDSRAAMLSPLNGVMYLNFQKINTCAI